MLYEINIARRIVMSKFFKFVIMNRIKILVLFVLMFIAGLILKPMVSVNYDMNSYLPEDSPSTVAVDVMRKEFKGDIPNARVMLKNVTIAETLSIKEKLSMVDGVTDVTWLDDSNNLNIPLSIIGAQSVDGLYKNNNALLTVTIEEHHILSAVKEISKLIGDDNVMTGAAVNTAAATTSTETEVQRITIIAILAVLIILTLTTTSWIEPLVVLAGLGMAVVINAGSNLMFGEISFVTNAAGNILQLAVSLDYSVFLIHRFAEFRENYDSPIIAMQLALEKSASSILSSGLTTVIGFLALILMRFGIGPDLGLALAKGIAISLIIVFVFMPGLILITYRLMDKTQHQSFMPSCRGFGRMITKIMLPLSGLFVLIIVPAYLGSINNEYYFGAGHIFGEDTKTGRDTSSIEDVFGKSDTYVMLVPKGNVLSESRLVDEIKALPQTGKVLAYVESIGVSIPKDFLGGEIVSKLESEHYSRIVIPVDVDYEGKETSELIEKIRNFGQKYYKDTYYLAGQGVTTYDLKETVTDDMVKVNLVAIGAVFVILLLTMKSFLLPLILVISIETAIWINMSIPYVMGSTLFYIAYLIISSVQLGATVDYAILFTDRYRENRNVMSKKESIVETVSNVTMSILTSGIALTVVGFLLGKISTHGVLSQLGLLIGRGTLCSLACVLFVLPGLLYITDRK